MSSDTPIRIMLADDHAVVRAGYTFLLENVDDIKVIAEASGGEEAVTLYAELQPDILVIDLTMPGMDGLEALRRIRRDFRDAKILVFTMHEDTAFVERALEGGASGYISKNSSPEVLVEAVRKLAAGDIYIDAGIAQAMVVQKTRGKDSPFASLSSREYQILYMFAEARSMEDIAAELSLSSKTVANYLTQIKDKLQVHSTAELVRLAISKGLVTV